MYTLNVFNLNNKNSARKRNPLSSALILISTQLYFTLTMYACSRSRSRGSMLSVSFWRNASAFRLGLWILNIFSSLLHIVGSIEELTFSLFPIKDQFRSVLKIIFYLAFLHFADVFWVWGKHMFCQTLLAPCDIEAYLQYEIQLARRLFCL